MIGPSVESLQSSAAAQKRRRRAAAAILANQMAALRVGFDTGPLFGPKTGVGLAVEAMHAALAARDDLELVDYVLSFRARPEPPTRRLPLPAALAHRLWARGGRPQADRWLHDVQVVHGTNYVVPPSRLPRLVSVYDCWFLRHPE